MSIYNIYICGAVTKDPKHEEKFKQAEEVIKKVYPTANVFNPVEECKRENKKTWLECMAHCKGLLDMTDLIVILPSWVLSHGATAEIMHATEKRIEMINYEEVLKKI